MLRSVFQSTFNRVLADVAAPQAVSESNVSLLGSVRCASCAVVSVLLRCGGHVAVWLLWPQGYQSASCTCVEGSVAARLSSSCVVECICIMAGGWLPSALDGQRTLEPGVAGVASSRRSVLLRRQRE